MSITTEQVQTWLGIIESLLPNIRPLHHFLHLNMFPDQMHEGFWEAMKNISRFYDIKPFIEREIYFEHYKSKKIDSVDLKWACDFWRKEGIEERFFTDSFLFASSRMTKVPEKGFRPLHQLISEKMFQSLNDLVEPQLYRYTSSFMDQGVAIWANPYQEKSLLKSFIELQLDSYLPMYPVRKKFLNEIKDKTSYEIISIILPKLNMVREWDYEYLRECIPSSKGWLGLIKNVSRDPNLLVDKRNVSLADYLAVRLILEWSWVEKLGGDKLSIQKNKENEKLFFKRILLLDGDFIFYQIWQTAFEQSILRKKIEELTNHLKGNDNKVIKNYKYQAIFCIDDRECLLRRKIEENDDSIQTFGTPGHFGLDIEYQSSPNLRPQKSCPAPVEARFLIRLSEAQPKKRNKYSTSIFDRKALETVIRSFAPSFFKIPDYVNVETQPVLEIFETNKGYSFEEAAIRVAQVLTSIGLTENFAQTILILGHSSTTTNNPYYMAYGCGACSGRPGYINAIVFSEMANHPEVRQLLQIQHHLFIPNNVTFVSGFHDTCSERITLYRSQDNIVGEELITSLARSLEKVAKDKMKDFYQEELSDESIKQKIYHRSQAIFEPRPELGHTNNAFCLIAPREMTRTFSFERQAFLQSYDPKNDLDGKILEGILMATFPVCAGINLDYFFSRVNNQQIGAGSKLSHNITSLLGLVHGTEDDLQTGLAKQMIENHQPSRINFIITQKKQIILDIFKRNPFLYKWAEGKWLHLVLIDPSSGLMDYYLKDDFVRFQQEAL